MIFWSGLLLCVWSTAGSDANSNVDTDAKWTAQVARTESEGVQYQHAGYLLAFFQHYSGTKAVSKRVACRYGKRMLVPDMWQMAIGIAQLDLPHYLVCILCEAALDSLGNCAPWMWIDRTVATVSQVEKIAQK